MVNRYPKQIQNLIHVLRSLPGVGHKSAERYAFHMLNWPKENLINFSKAITDLSNTRSICPSCGCLLENENCIFCTKERYESKILCVCANLKDVYAVDQTSMFKGAFHVLGGILSPINGKDASKLNWQKLVERINTYQIEEVILAIEGTLDGDATAFWLKSTLENKCPHSPKISRLAFGLSIGSSIDNTDEITLAKAFFGRQFF